MAHNLPELWTGSTTLVYLHAPNAVLLDRITSPDRDNPAGFGLCPNTGSI